MDAEQALRARFWTLLVVVLAMRTWFAFRVWRAGERILADRAALAREGPGARVTLWVFYSLTIALGAYVFLQRGGQGSLRDFGFPGAAAALWVRWAGVVLGAASVGLFVWTHVVLGRHWSPYLQLRAGHRLITDGPYARVRHPMYSAILGWMASLGLVAANWIPLAFAAIVAANFILRIRGEEAMMLEQFGDEYRQYMKRTGRLLPAWS
jgi:protein-S-isoprenylcysteine O-methyltransferase Ste14